MYDVIVAGGGPAGLTAALYALRNGKSVLVIEKEGFGGQITHSPRVENFPGTLCISGNELADQMLDQILAQGAELEVGNVISVSKDDGVFSVRTEEGGDYESKAVILATGVKHRMLGLPGETELVGEGISYCAVCDGDFYEGKSVCVAGGGNSALQEAILLAGKCREVTVLQDLPYLTGEAKLQEALFANGNVKAVTGVKITGLVSSEDGLSAVEIREEESGITRRISCDGLFVAIGLIPENDAFADLAYLTDDGYFDSDETCVTATPGVFAAGDCRRKEIRQLTAAASDGASAALAACRYIDGIS